MSRGTRFLTVILPLVFLYLLALFRVISLPLVSARTAELILPVLPFWFLVSFGSYSLASLGLGLLRFKDCPEAYQSLLLEITQAKNELRDQGVSVD